MEGTPFPGFEDGGQQTDAGDEIEMGLMDEDAPPASASQSQAELVVDDDDDDDLAFELSDDDFF